MSSLSRELGFLARQSLANALNTTSPLGKDWRGLADKMGFTYEMITVLQTQESPTLSLLEEWERQLGREANLSTLIELVESLGCLDAAEHLRRAQAEKRNLRMPSFGASPSCSSDNGRRVSAQSNHLTRSPDTLVTPPNSLATDSTFLSSGLNSHELSYKIEQLAIHNEDPGYHGSCEEKTMVSKQRCDIFLSFAQEDREFAEEVKARLQTKKKLKVFIPSEDVMPGEVFSEQVADMIKQGCRKTVIILSPAYLRSPWCSFESHLALHHSPDSKEHILIPVLYQKCTIPSFLSHICYADYTRYSQDPSKCEQYFWDKVYKACQHTVSAPLP
ncbi:hypothetical protein EMCRGX_G006254 [Ephydatia muelleri]